MKQRWIIGVVMAAPLLLAGGARALEGAPPDRFGGYEPTRLIVKFRAGTAVDPATVKGLATTGLPEVDALHARYGVTAQRRLVREGVPTAADNPLRSTFLFAIPSGGDIEAMARDYRALASVEYAMPDYAVELYASPNDPLYVHQWALHNTGQGHYHVEDGVLSIVYGTPDADIDAEEVFANPPDQTATVVVAIVDTGVDWDHPDLVSRMWQNPGEIADNGIDDDRNGYIDDLVGWDFSANDLGDPPFAIWEDNDPTDPMGHGTHCAGIVAGAIGNGIGIAGAVADVRIMALKFYPYMPLSAAAAGIVYAADNGADVISMSWGLAGQIPVVEEALGYAAARGVVLIASIGNDGIEQINYPASYDLTVAVGATNDSDHVTSFSTISPYIDVCAPGRSILSLRAAGTDMYAPSEPNVHIVDSQYYIASGTSMSGPYTAAVAAYVRSLSPGLDRERVREILHATADDYVDPYGTGASYPGWDKYSGWGRVNLASAIAAAPDVRAIITSPGEFEIAAGTIAILGTADGADFTEYRLQYRPAAADTSAWTDLLTSTVPVTAGWLGDWNVSGLPTAEYVLRLQVGQWNRDMVRVSVGGAALAEIASPGPGDTVNGGVTVTGTCFAPDFVRCVIDYGAGLNPTEWHAVDTTTRVVFAGELGRWDVSLLDDGLYTLRVQVYGAAGPIAGDEAVVQVYSPFAEPLGWSLDFDRKIGRIATYADVDGDGVNEIILGTATNVVFLTPDGTLKTTGVPTLEGGDFTHVMPAVGRLDGDDAEDFVVMDLSGKMYICHGLSTEPTVVSLNAPTMTTASYGSSANAPVLFLRDLDGDGIDEINYSAGLPSSGSFRIVRADGSPWLWCGADSTAPSGYQECHPADLDGDGVCEIYCYGTVLRKFDAQGCSAEGDTVALVQDGLSIGRAGLSLSSADLDADGDEELIVLGDSWIDPVTPVDHAIYAIDENLQSVAGWPHAMGLGAYIPVLEPAFADLDGDGALEYVCANWNAIRAWRLDGSPLMGDSASFGYFCSSMEPGVVDHLVIGDVTGDYRPDVAALIGGDFLSGYEVSRIEAYSDIGALQPGFPMTITSDGSGFSRCPTLCDLDKDGYLDVICPSQNGINGRLVLHRFAGVRYRPEQLPSPMWRQNRRLNASAALNTGEGCCVLRGDIVADGQIRVSDLTLLVGYLFRGGPAAECLAHADIDANRMVQIADLTALVSYLFRGGPPPAPCG